jgi:acyl carrier protein
MTNTDVKLKDILAKVLLVDKNEISDDLSRKDVEEWDSMSHLMLVSEIESVFDVTLSDDDIIGIHKVSDIKRILKKNGVV